MRKNLLVIFIFFIALATKAQTGFVFNCTKDTIIGCTQNCITLKGYIPNIHSLSDDYDVTSLSAGLCAIQVPSSTVQGTPTNINLDDRYTQVIPLPFDFPFYGIFYSQIVASSNGIISFDDLNANQFSHYGILRSGGFLSALGGTPEDLPSTLYDRAIIMGPYHDINIQYPTSPNRKIYYQVDGVAPYRRWILAFFEIPLFYTTDGCDLLIKNTHQIILNESTGIIDVFVYDKQICMGWNQGRAMIGLQNYDQDKGVMVPGRRASSPPWGSVGMNEAWRFTPKNGPSLYQRVELLDNMGNVVANGDTASINNSVLSVDFPNFCPVASGLYVIKSTYLKFDDPTVEVYGYDTINVILNTSVPPVTADTTRAVCGGNGTITVTAPIGPNYEYSINNGVNYQYTTSFSVPPGNYTVLVHDTSGICTNSVNVTVTSASPLAATAVATNASCPGATNGSIAVHVSQGVPGFSFLIDTMTVYQSDSVFNNLAVGPHVITVKDNAGCTYVFNSNVLANPGFTTTATSANASCSGVSNGTITVVQPSTGTTPFKYSIPGVINIPQLSNVLTGLAGGTSYTVKVEDASGCTYSFSQAVANGTGVTATFSSINSACSGVSTGQIVITPTAGTAPFYYSTDGGVTFPALDTIRNLASGSYTIKVKDAVGCIYDSPPVTVNNNAGVTATFTTINSACSGVSTGQIIITPTAGTGPFSYSNNGGVTYLPLDTIRNLAGGVYNLKVKDAVGCVYDVPPVTVNNNIGVTATFTTINSACSGVSTGQIIITPTAGTGPFSYSNNGGVTYLPLDTIRNLAGGVYNIKVKDAVGCVYDVPPVTVNNNIGVTATFTTINSACAAASTGQIIINPTAGIAPFYYSMDGGLTYPVLDTIRNLAGGTYNIKLKDAVGCIYDLPSVTVNSNNPGVGATFTTINSACSGVSTGQIVITPTIGIAPFSYSIDGGLTFPALDTIRNLAGGSYTIKVRDGLGCTYDAPAVTVNNNIGVTATFSTINSACSGVSTGQIIIQPTAGTAPFYYSADGGITYPALDTIRNLAGGTYNVKVKDAVGCVFDSPLVTVSNSIGVTATFTTVNSACAAASTGQIIINPTAGTAPFYYSLDGGITYPALDTIRNLSGGAYTIKVKDAVGCIYDAPPVTVNSNNPGVGATFATVNSACSGVSTGQIIITPTVGIAPFRYSIDGGVTFPSLDTIRNLAGGSYTLKVRDALGCTFDAPPVTVSNNVGVTATFSTVNSACSVASTGQIIIKPTTGIAPFYYSMDGGITYPVLDTIRNLTGGTYNLKIKDAVGCIYDAPPVTVNSNNPGVSATFASVNAACSGVSSGQIIITPTSGVSPYSYSIDGGVTFPPLDTIRNLASGSYQIKVRDALGCTVDAPPVSVNNNIGVTATYTLVKAACAGSATGAIIVKPTTGSPVFRYSLDGGVNYQYDSVFRNLAANTYTITIKDTAGCIVSSTAQNLTSNPGVLTSASTIKNASCASVPNGSIAVNVTAGITPFTYTNISVPGATPQTANLFSSLFSGSYDITITDSAGCTKTITAIVGNDPKIKFDNLDIVRPTCNGLSDGSITVNASLGVAPYQFAIDAGAYSNLKTITGVAAGPHILHVKDANSCIIDSAVVITEPAILTNALVSTTASTCSGNADGKIVVAAAGGTLPYLYTLDAAGLSGYQPATDFPVLAGTYKVTVKDANACKAILNVVVDSVFTMFLDLGRDTTICAEQSVLLNPLTNGETSVFTYTPSSSLDKADIKNPTAKPADTTTYTLTAQWGICKLTDKITVNVLRKPVAHAGPDVVICYDTTSVLHASATNLSGTVNYLWSPASLLDGRADTTVVTARPDTFITYYTVTVTDNYGCNYAVTDSVLVNMLPPVYAFAGNDTNAVLGAAHQLTATGAGVGGTYEWTYPAGVVLSNNQIGNPTAIFSPVDQPGTFHPDTNYYKLSVIATNQAGCRATDTVKINVFKGPTYYVPTAFTPNGDGFNDIFRPILVGINNTEYFRVFNRYGQVVFETNRFMEGWDGKFKGQDQPIGNYVWAIKGKSKNGRPVEMKGSVLLIR